MADGDDFNGKIISEFRANGGNVGGFFEGQPMLLLHHNGAKTGAERVNPLVYQQVGSSYAVFGSAGGQPRDPQWFRNLIADYAAPGQILEFNRAGRILYRYRAVTGPGMLNHPSLAELLPSGVFMTNDDYNDRMAAIDPATGALVWQYGITGKPGTAPGELNTPDGFDLLLPDGSTPTHPVTG